MGAYEFDTATVAKITEFETALENAQADIIKYSIKKQQPVFEQRDAVLKTVDKFWSKALQNCTPVSMYIDDEDRDALQHLNAIRVERNLEDPREATIHFDFDENKYFSNKTITKAFKVLDGAEALGSDDFEFSNSVSTNKAKIDWKSDEVNLSKISPAMADTRGEADEDEAPPDPGSFFSSFFEDDKLFSVPIGDSLINDFYPRAIDYYKDLIDDDFGDSDSGAEYEDGDLDSEEDEEDNDDADREIDLEEEEAREAKRARK